MSLDSTDSNKFFRRLREAAAEDRWIDDRSEDFPEIFEQLVQRFETLLHEFNESRDPELSKSASEHLREIVFMDGCLGPLQRRNLGARLLASWLLATKNQPEQSDELVEIFRTAPASDYLLAYALAWNLGSFEESSKSRRESEGPERQSEKVTPLNFISLHSIKGGTGKTLLAQLYARTLAKSGQRVAIVDLDFTGPTLQFLGRSTQSTLLRPFPLFFEKKPLPILHSVKNHLPEKIRNSGSHVTAKDLGEQIQEVITKTVDRPKIVPFRVTGHTPDANFPNDDVKQDWENSYEACKRGANFFSPEGNYDIDYVALPHRPEFLRRAAQILHSPTSGEWLVVRRWLEWLIFSKLRDNYDTVIFDNAPGTSNSAVIMNLVWTLAARNRQDRCAVCLVTTPRTPDLLGAAYELLWLQASDWTQMEDPNRRLYWIGNMWDSKEHTLEAFLSGEVEWPFWPSGQRRNTHEAARIAHSLAGLNNEDMKRIATVLKIAFQNKRVITSTHSYTSELRTIFDFTSVGASELGEENLKILEEIKTMEPVKSLVSP